MNSKINIVFPCTSETWVSKMRTTDTDTAKLEEVKKLFESLKTKLNNHLGPELIEESVEVFQIRRLVEDITWAFKDKR